MTYSRQDVWALPVTDTTIVDYARAVAVMKSRDSADPTSWSFQAAMHGSTTEPGTWPYNQCKHASWWFLPWHRMYLWYFEQIVRAAVIQLGGSSDWALPYWNYGAGGQHATLPLAFRGAQVNNAPNPLFSPRAAAMNDGSGSIPPQIGNPVQAMNCASFVGSYQTPPPEFGGGPADPSLQFAGPTGVLENTPHNQVHNLVGGLMGNPDTAAADPVFWLHHANIDRIWDAWADGSVPHQDPADSAWLSQSFKFYDAQGKEASLTCAEVLHIVQQLDYEYVSPAAPSATVGVPKVAAAMASPADGGARRASELVGASEATVELTGTPVDVPVTIDPRAVSHVLSSAGEDAPRRVYLTVQEIEGEEDPGTVYGIYVNLPDAQASPEVAASHYAGALSFFGVARAQHPRADEPPHGLTVSHDITALARDLQAEGQWDDQRVVVSFRPTGLVPPDQPELAHALREEPAASEPPIRIGRVSIFYA